MSIILYDDDFNTIGVEIPPYASITQDISVNQKWSVTLPATNENVVRQILEYIKLRNQTLTFNSQQNINGRIIGDYTCAVSINGYPTYAKITVNSSSDSNTRFTDPTTKQWQKDGATVSLNIEEVTT